MLWIVLDTARADRFAWNGGDPDLAPNLNALAARGSAWSQAWAQAPSTMLSVTSMFSGRHRSNHGQLFRMGKLEDFQALHPDITTVAEALGTVGVVSTGLVGNNVIAPLTPDPKLHLAIEQGFATWEPMRDRQVVDGAVRFLHEIQPGDDPFLLYVHLLGPHVDNERRPGFADRHGVHEQRLGRATADLYRRISSGQQAADPADVSYLSALYDEALWHADAQLGQVLDTLDRTGLADTTLVVFTSDHGELLGDYRDPWPVFGHGMALNETLLRVPLVLAGPGVPEGRVDDSHLVELLDLPPTVASHVGVPIDPAWRWEGRDLLAGDLPAGGVAMADMGGTKNRVSGIRDRSHVVLYEHSLQRTRYLLAEDERTPLTALAPHHDLAHQMRVHLQTAEPPQVTEYLAQPAPEGAQLEALKALGYMD